MKPWYENFIKKKMAGVVYMSHNTILNNNGYVVIHCKIF